MLAYFWFIVAKLWITLDLATVIVMQSPRTRTTLFFCLINFSYLNLLPVQSSLFGNNWNIRIEPIVSRELNMVDLVDEVHA